MESPIATAVLYEAGAMTSMPEMKYQCSVDVAELMLAAFTVLLPV